MSASSKSSVGSAKSNKSQNTTREAVTEAKLKMEKAARDENTTREAVTEAKVKMEKAARDENTTREAVTEAKVKMEKAARDENTTREAVTEAKVKMEKAARDENTTREAVTEAKLKMEKAARDENTTREAVTEAKVKMEKAARDENTTREAVTEAKLKMEKAARDENTTREAVTEAKLKMEKAARDENTTREAVTEAKLKMEKAARDENTTREAVTEAKLKMEKAARDENTTREAVTEAKVKMEKAARDENTTREAVTEAKVKMEKAARDENTTREAVTEAKLKMEKAARDENTTREAVTEAKLKMEKAARDENTTREAVTEAKLKMEKAARDENTTREAATEAKLKMEKAARDENTTREAVTEAKVKMEKAARDENTTREAVTEAKLKMEKAARDENTTREAVTEAKLKMEKAARDAEKAAAEAKRKTEVRMWAEEGCASRVASRSHAEPPKSTQIKTEPVFEVKETIPTTNAHAHSCTPRHASPEGAPPQPRTSVEPLTHYLTRRDLVTVKKNDLSTTNEDPNENCSSHNEPQPLRNKEADCKSAGMCSECGSTSHDTAMHPDPYLETVKTPSPSQENGGEGEDNSNMTVVRTSCTEVCDPCQWRHSGSKPGERMVSVKQKSRRCMLLLLLLFSISILPALSISVWSVISLSFTTPKAFTPPAGNTNKSTFSFTPPVILKSSTSTSTISQTSSPEASTTTPSVSVSATSTLLDQTWPETAVASPPSPLHTTAPLFEHQPFIVTWNIPDLVCNRYNISLDTSPFKGVSTPAKVPGQFLTLFYRDRLGLYPHVKLAGKKLINGGIPQTGNLTASMIKAREDINFYITSKTSPGLAVIDWEEWRPLWDRNWGSKRIYRTLSVAHLMQTNRSLTEEQATEKAKQQFQEAAKSFMSETLAMGRSMRPNYLWGFYLFPNCYNYGWEKVKYTGHCSEKVKRQNDELLWLWESSTALYPSIYLQVSLADNPRAALMVRNRVQEAVRVSALPGGSSSAPVFVYTRPVFIHHNKRFLSQGDLVNTIGESAAVGASGVVLWGASADYDDQTSCSSLSSFLSTTLNPYITNVTVAAQLCSNFLCRGNGRCVRKNYDSDHYLHLNPDSFTILHVQKRYLVLGKPTLMDLKALSRSFTCRCYTGLSCSPRTFRELEKALIFSVKQRLYHKFHTVNKATLDDTQQANITKDSVKNYLKIQP